MVKCNIHAWSLKSFTSGSCEKKNTGRNAQMKQNQISFEFKIENAYNRTTLLCEYSVDRTTSSKRHHAANVFHLSGYAISRSHDDDDVKITRLSRVQLNNLMTKYSNKNNQLFLLASRLLKWTLFYERFMQWYREFCGFKLIFLFLFLAISDYFINIS